MSILVHTGKAHADDFLAACVCCCKLNKPIFRKSFTQQDLENPDCWVLDQGGKYEPELHNFDHHHLEQEICSFTMVLDYFYGKEYRSFLPSFRYVEIFDSYGSEKAANFIGAKQDKLDIATSPIHTYVLKAFSKTEGEIQEPFSSLMKLIGKEICEQIESNQQMMSILDKDAIFFEYQGIKILDTTKCIMPDGLAYDVLPTKFWSKINNINPTVILTRDSRKENAYRMVSVNTNNIRFENNEKSYFTHASGFVCAFDNYSDYTYILTNYSKKS